MKIRKLKIKNYKIFEDVEFDFTDENGKTLDTIILTGINGTGKTTLLELIAKILTPEIKLKKHFNNFNIEIEFEAEEIKILQQELSHKIHEDEGIDYFFHEISKNNVVLFYPSEKQIGYINDNDKLEEEIYYILGNFYLLPLISKILNNYKIAAFHNNIFSKKNKNESASEKDKFTSDTLKFINYENYEQHLEAYFDKAILQYLKSHRKLTYDDIVTKRISEINTLLKSLKINTKIVDIDENKLILENLSGKKLGVKDLSAGEKQIYYRAIFLLSLNLQNSLILVDEPEISLHPTWQSSLLSLYENTGENNQVFIATHSPHIIGKTAPENVFLLKYQDKKIVVEQPKYTKGHSIPYVLSEIMDSNYNDTHTNEIVEKYLKLIRKGKHETTEGEKLLEKINLLSPESEERVRVRFSLERFKAIGR